MNSHTKIVSLIDNSVANQAYPLRSDAGTANHSKSQ